MDISPRDPLAQILTALLAVTSDAREPTFQLREHQPDPTVRLAVMEKVKRGMAMGDSFRNLDGKALATAEDVYYALKEDGEVEVTRQMNVYVPAELQSLM